MSFLGHFSARWEPVWGQGWHPLQELSLLKALQAVWLPQHLWGALHPPSLTRSWLVCSFLRTGSRVCVLTQNEQAKLGSRAFTWRHCCPASSALPGEVNSGLIGTVNSHGGSAFLNEQAGCEEIHRGNPHRGNDSRKVLIMQTQGPKF